MPLIRRPEYQTHHERIRAYVSGLRQVVGLGTVNLHTRCLSPPMRSGVGVKVLGRPGYDEVHTMLIRLTRHPQIPGVVFSMLIRLSPIATTSCVRPQGEI